MEPEGKRPLTIAALAILVVVIILLKGFAPLVRLQVISTIIAAWHARRRNHDAVTSNGSTTLHTALRRNWIIVAIFGPPPPSATVDIEQGSIPPASTVVDPAASTASLAYPPPTYMEHHKHRLWKGSVIHNHPFRAGAALGRDVPVVSAGQPPPYASVSSFGGTASPSTAH
ncbi:hypothetical protein FRB90_002166 [Tulasnella sp. 427]|nr:hypothetical protein FRB90_002166 [Tulasnella sp. 427]